jgi:hypothetical protein
VKHTVAKQAHAQCTSCGPACTFQGACGAGKVGFYTDAACTQLIVSIPVGTCTQTNKSTAPLGGMTYTATGTFTGCTATGTSTASLDLPGARTVCCRP